MKIHIHVDTEFLSEYSDMVRDSYAFAYHITITNQDDETVTLRNRHWEVTDALGKTETVDGAGVVGEEPVLLPSGQFSYTSGARLHTPWGNMVGRYEFERLDGTRFWVPIPAFELKAPLTLQ